MKTHTICIAGNPNCGKTTLFNAMTGLRQDVGNWPGVTIERKVGEFRLGKDVVELVDLPGTYSLTPSGSSGEDERIARDYILSGEPQAVINIVDASNLERNLYLTTQLLELRVPMLVVVNMVDIAREMGMEIDYAALSRELGCPVVGVVASRETGIEELKKEILHFLEHLQKPALPYRFPEDVEIAHNKMEALLRPSLDEKAHSLAMHILETGPDENLAVPGEVAPQVKDLYDELNARYDGDLDIVVADTRYQFVSKVCETALERRREVSHTLTDKIDRIVLNRWLGLPIFLLIMYVMFLFTQNLGAVFIDFFDVLVGGIFVDGFGALLTAIGAPEWLKVFLADGLGGGLQTVSTFIPVVLFLYLFLAFLEDSGYMARAAFVMDRLMAFLGLPGKAFVPLIVGFGCNVPAIMATRTLDRTNDRIITTLMAPFMSCGARLPVYVLFATAFYPHNGQNLVFLLYVIGLVFAVLTGFLLKRVALKGDVSPFVMEIPPYHIPTLKGVLRRTWDRVRDFTVRAGRVIVVIVCFLSFFNSLGTDGSFGNEDSDKSVLSSVGRAIVPVLAPMGVQEDNWPAAVGIFTGVFAKEAVVGTLDSLYSSIDRQEGAAADAAEGEEEAEPWSLGAVLAEAGGTVVDNFAGLSEAFSDPLGIAVDDEATVEASAQEQGVDLSTIGSMQRLFGSTTAAFAYLLMVLLYMPCVAAIAAVYREVGPAWTVFSGAWCTVLGYSAATIYYRTATFAADPATAVVCIIGSLIALALMVVWMRTLANRDRKGQRRVIPIRAQ